MEDASVAQRALICSLPSLLAAVGFMERGAFAVVLPQVTLELGMTPSQEGLVLGVLILGYTAFTPLFAHLAMRIAPLRVAGVAAMLWALSTFGAAVSQTFLPMLLARLSMGSTEAAGLALAPAMTDALAPAEKRGKWLSSVYLVVPIGYGIGFGLGGAWSTMEDSFFTGWRALLGLHAVLMSLLSVSHFLLRGPVSLLTVLHTDTVEIAADNDSVDIENTSDLIDLIDPTPHGSSDNSGKSIIDHRLMPTMKALLCNAPYLVLVLSFTAQTFTLGATGFYVPTFLQEVYEWAPSRSGLVFGIQCIVIGLLGTSAGGFVLDRLACQPTEVSDEESTLLDTHAEDEKRRHTTRVLWLITLLALVASFACISFVGSELQFFLSFCVAQFFALAQLSPINWAMMRMVSPVHRAMALALSTVSIHMLGDGISPIIIGAVQEAMRRQGYSDTKSLRIALTASTAGMPLAFVAAVASTLLFRRLQQ
ncbi:MAG: hypothetical protein MHM6MM_002843 [Cercozoa sp. M6MM]